MSMGIPPNGVGGGDLGVELSEGNGVPRKRLIEEGQSVWGSRSLNGAWIRRLHSPTVPSQSSRLLRTRLLDQCLQVVQRALWRSDFGHST